MKRQQKRSGWPVVGAGVAGALLAMSCAGPQTVEWARPYPNEKPQRDVLNVHVIREETSLVLTNSSARSFGPCTVWVNAAYSRPFEGMEIGETVRLSLDGFRDEYSTPFRAGGFFATEAADTVSLVQIELDDQLVGLVMVGSIP